MESPHLRAAIGGTVFAMGLGLMPVLTEASEPDHRSQVLNAIRDGLPKFGEKDPLPQRTPEKAPPVHSGVSANPPTDPAAAPTPKNPVSRVVEGAIEMPKITIHPFPDILPEPQHALPHLPVAKTYSDAKVDDFLTGPARDKVLIEKHLSSFDRNFLNRFTLPIVGIPLKARAREAEASEKNAVLLNEVADLLNLEQQLGIETEEDRKLRKEYFNLMRTRPR